MQQNDCDTAGGQQLSLTAEYRYRMSAAVNAQKSLKQQAYHQYTGINTLAVSGASQCVYCTGIAYWRESDSRDRK
jgi:hypothetical protein